MLGLVSTPARAVLFQCAMQTIHDFVPNDAGTSADSRVFWQRLLYRWFVEYNPAYLLSAAFVFGGCFLWSRGVVHDDALTSTLGIPLVAELYAVALAGGAALLTRLGQRRPAVMLGLIFVVYQWDTTLHTEACAFLGAFGTYAALGWLAIFGGKMWAIARALRIRVAPRMVAAFSIAAVGLVLFPRVLPLVGARGAGSLLAAWSFALASLARGGELESKDALDAWGTTVLRRATHAVWAISAAMLLVHATMWCGNAEVSLAPLVAVAPLLFVRRIRSELRTWAMIAATLVSTAWIAPEAFFAACVATAGALLLRIFAPDFAAIASRRAAEPERVRVPYRAGARAYACEPRFVVEHEPAPALDAAEIARAWAGVLFASHLAAWSVTWSHGAFPSHVLLLDEALTLAAALGARLTRAKTPFAVPLIALYTDLVVRGNLLPVPHSGVAWGELAIALGFALLGGSLFVSYRLRHFTSAPTPPAPS